MTAGGLVRRAPRGVTLVEMLVALVVAAVIIAGALGLLMSQQRAFRTSAGDRAMQDAARTGLEELSANLRRAGYGIEPWLAFDFGPIGNAPPSWPGGPATTTAGYPSGRPGAAPPACTPAVTPASRDGIAGPDEIVFHSRDPGFNRRLAAAPTSTLLTLATALRTPLEIGQILQVMCDGAAAWAYVTVGARADAGATTVTLDTTCNASFPYQQDQLAAGCFAAGFPDVRVFKVDRFHYYVDRFDGRPYLMLDRGLWRNGAALVEPVAPDVEDVQFAYIFASAAAAVATRVGATPGTQLASSAASIDLAAVPPSYDEPAIAASRGTQHPANIRAVQTSVLVRTSGADVQLVGPLFQTVPAAANRPTLGGDANHRRLLVETTDATRNLDSRGPLYPAYSVNNGADGLNVGGG